MPTERHNDPAAFRTFLDHKLADPSDVLTLAEILALWEAENQTDDEREEVHRWVDDGLSAAASHRHSRPPNAV